MHPTVVCRAYNNALQHALKICKGLAKEIDPSDPKVLKDIVRACVGTKYSSRFGDFIVDLAIQATLQVTVSTERDGEVGMKRKEIDIKRCSPNTNGRIF